MKSARLKGEEMMAMIETREMREGERPGV